MELWETHCHTKQVSGCARSLAEEMVEAYWEAGYQGIVVTDHFETYTMLQRCPYETWEERVAWHLAGFHAAKEAAGDRLKVLWGLELRFTTHGNDYLVYGITKEQLLEASKEGLLEWGIQKFSAFARERGIVVIAAHPFRVGMTVIRPEFVDGIEVHNGNLNQNSHNDLALLWADRYGLAKSSGSDAHDKGQVGTGGIITQETIHSMADFCRVMLDQDGKKQIIS